jgi:Zn-dependent protease with chaperone function
MTTALKNINPPKTNARLTSIAVGVLLLSSCATSTAPGAVGVQRQQLLLVPAAAIQKSATEGFSKLSSEAAGKGKLNSNAAVTSRVRAIGMRLVGEVRTYRSDAAGWAWEINVFDSPEVNAFCMPGGKIGVYTGLIDKLKLTDDELAAVMGHEIAHALREHSREKVSQQTLSQGIVAGLAASSRSPSATGVLAGVTAQMFLHLPFSREMELEADVMGMELMARAGFDPRNAPQVWRKMATLSTGAGKSQGSDFFSTHPSGARRIQAMEAIVPKVLPLYEGRKAAPA